jgi:hypothetical protein
MILIKALMKSATVPATIQFKLGNIQFCYALALINFLCVSFFKNV